MTEVIHVYNRPSKRRQVKGNHPSKFDLWYDTRRKAKDARREEPTGKWSATKVGSKWRVVYPNGRVLMVNADLDMDTPEKAINYAKAFAPDTDRAKDAIGVPARQQFQSLVKSHVAAAEQEYTQAQATLKQLPDSSWLRQKVIEARRKLERLKESGDAAIKDCENYDDTRDGPFSEFLQKRGFQFTSEPDHAKDSALTIYQARDMLARVGMVIVKVADEIQVNFKDGHDATAYYANDLEDAVNTGLSMSKHKLGDKAFRAKVKDDFFLDRFGSKILWSQAGQDRLNALLAPMRKPVGKTVKDVANQSLISALAHATRTVYREIRPDMGDIGLLGAVQTISESGYLERKLSAGALKEYKQLPLDERYRIMRNALRNYEGIKDAKPTRIQIQEFYTNAERSTGLKAVAREKTERAFDLYDLKVDNKGQIIGYKFKQEGFREEDHAKDAKPTFDKSYWVRDAAEWQPKGSAESWTGLKGDWYLHAALKERQGTTGQRAWFAWAVNKNTNQRKDLGKHETLMEAQAAAEKGVGTERKSLKGG